MIEQGARMREVKLSRIREIMDYCTRLEKQGRTMIDLTNGEPDFITPAYIRDAAKKALDDGKTGYAPMAGIDRLRAAIAKKLEREDHVVYGADEILVTNGGTQSTFLAMMAFLNPGDEVLLPDPGYTIYPEIAKFAGAVVKTYKLKRENGFQIDIAELRRRICARTKMLLLLSPSNPIGAVLSRATLEQVAELVRGKDILVLSDEVYERLVYGGMSHFSIARIEGIREQTVILNSFSKTYAMTGWRIGYVAAPRRLIEPMMRLNAITTCGANHFVQWAAVHALDEETNECEEMRVAYADRIERVVSAIRAIDGLSCEMPEGAFYVFIDITGTGLGSEEFVKYIIDEASVALVPGNAFGEEGEGYVRMCCAKSIEELMEAIHRIGKAVERLRGRETGV